MGAATSRGDGHEVTLFGRATNRDLADVDALSRHYSREQLYSLAEEKDFGFDRAILADAFNAAAGLSAAAFGEVGLDVAAAALRQRAMRRREDLHGGETGDRQ